MQYSDFTLVCINSCLHVLSIKTANMKLRITSLPLMAVMAFYSVATLAQSSTSTSVYPPLSLKGQTVLLDAGYMADLHNAGHNWLEFSASYGYRFNNYFFLGGGVGAHPFLHTHDGWIQLNIPLYSHFRVNFTSRKITPFIDTKLGVVIGDIPGLYLAQSLGVRYGLTRKMALSARLELSTQGGIATNKAEGDYNWSDKCYDTRTGLGVKVGFEF